GQTTQCEGRGGAPRRARAYDSPPRGAARAALPSGGREGTIRAWRSRAVAAGKEVTMPKLPRGMFKRGKRFYFRERINYRDKWVSLGPASTEACRKLQEMRAGIAPPVVSKATVVELADLWLEKYIATAREPKSAACAKARARKYLKPFFEHQ